MTTTNKIIVNKKNTLAGHKDCIYKICVSSLDKKTFFSADGSGMVARWNLENPEIGDLIIKIPNSVYAMTLLVDEENLTEKLLVAQNFEGLHLINLKEKKEEKSIKITNDYIFDVIIIEKNAWVACGDGTIIIVDIENWAIKKYIKTTEKSARKMTFNKKLNQVAVGFSDCFICIFDANTFLPLHHFEAHKNSVFAIQFSPCGQYLISGSRDAHLKVWNINDNFSLYQDIVAHLYALNDISFRSDGQYFATCSMDKSVKIWNSKTFKLLKVIDKSRHAGHATSVNTIFWADFEDNLLSAGDDKLISIWEID
ncbi:MAG: WD40 repeat domain-containing protein [Bacteroidetes bacterium]|nr:MAG: WD40 repeat domain-containing protein [Bacteroidota bacterium]TAG88251.1 MAG: WD40 repeat domain-containing protein [Bacteroidota bacterium]